VLADGDVVRNTAADSIKLLEKQDHEMKLQLKHEVDQIMVLTAGLATIWTMFMLTIREQDEQRFQEQKQSKSKNDLAVELLQRHQEEISRLKAEIVSLQRANYDAKLRFKSDLMKTKVEKDDELNAANLANDILKKLIIETNRLH
jgi:PDZ domain-containing secreted protein